MLVCHCHAVNDHRIAGVLAAGANGLPGVVRATRAGTDCGRCLPALRRVCAAKLQEQQDTAAMALCRESALAG